MPGRLTPVEPEYPQPANAPGPAAAHFAVLTRDRLERLAREMPDCQSAVLLCLAWQATLHERMRWGPFAGRPIASLSGSQLARMTGRPLRTVRHATRRLCAAGLIAKGGGPPGRKNSYTLAVITATGGARGDLRKARDTTCRGAGGGQRSFGE